MITPFDDMIRRIQEIGYHNHRREEHSDLVSEGVLRDLRINCPSIDKSLLRGVDAWVNAKAPGLRQRKIDLLIGEPSDSGGGPNLAKARICLENKTVMTAHRNRDARFDDLNQLVHDIYDKHPDVIMIATVVVGTAPRTLNIPDSVKKAFKGKEAEFESTVRPRLSTGDESLWEEYAWAQSTNRVDDAKKTIEKFRDLPTRDPARTHICGFDYLLIVPAFVDNVSPPRLERQNAFGIDIDAEYRAMLDTICRAYQVRWP